MTAAASPGVQRRAVAAMVAGVLCGAGVLLVLAGCMGPREDTGAAARMTVFAAASLRDVFADLEAAWQVDHPGAGLAVALDGSNVLAAQVAAGAPADVLVSADPAGARALLDAGHAAGPMRTLATTQVALVVPAGSDRVQTVDDLAKPGVRLVAAGPGVPISAYAEAALAQLARQRPDAAAFSAAVAANVVSREDNVRAALAKVELGEGDAAFVYHTDALATPGVREIPLEGVRVVAEYTVLQVAETDAAGELGDWLVGADAAAVLGAAGFEVPPS